MFSTQLQLKFASIAEGKIAAQTLCELLKSRISIYDFHGLHVTIGKEGELAVGVRFEEVTAMTKFVLIRSHSTLKTVLPRRPWSASPCFPIYRSSCFDLHSAREVTE